MTEGDGMESEIGGRIKKQVYIRDEETVWIAAEIVEKHPNQTVTVRTSADVTQTVSLRDYRGLELPKYCPKVEPDLTDLTFLHEAAVLHNLRARNSAGHPYTRSSTTTIVAVNPFEWHDTLYNETTRQRYAQEFVWKKSDDDNHKNAAAGATRQPPPPLQPHLYEVSARAYAELMMEQRNQSILVTGESGSGKTESTKLLLHHIAGIAGGGGSGGSSSTHGRLGRRHGKNNPTNTVQRILDSHPCLEAFGNAATTRNDNSSRFGKYIELQFRGSGGGDSSSSAVTIPILSGSRTWQYLLETARICRQAVGERSFHIFYQLLASPDRAQYWEGLRDKTVSDFKYLGESASSSIHEIDGVSDADRFRETVNALRTCKVPVQALLQAVCMTLQLGNLLFAASNQEDKAVIASQDELKVLSKLMGISTADLTISLTERTMKAVRGETFKVSLSPAQSQEACDALAKEIYAKSFQWLVKTINQGTQATHFSGTIGLLDIFGFESFETNGFGQLCINYANEKLQQKASNDIFLKTRDEYVREGIPLQNVEFEDNERVLAVLEGRTTGVMALLNEECHIPSGSDRGFVQKVLRQHKNSKYVTGPSQKRYATQFGIVHYAGKVLYMADDFVNQNKDGLPVDLKECAKKSSNEFLAKHFEDPIPTPEEAEMGGPAESAFTSLASSTHSILEDESDSMASDFFALPLNTETPSMPEKESPFALARRTASALAERSHSGSQMQPPAKDLVATTRSSEPQQPPATPSTETESSFAMARRVAAERVKKRSYSSGTLRRPVENSPATPSSHSLLLSSSYGPKKASSLFIAKNAATEQPYSFGKKSKPQFHTSHSFGDSEKRKEPIHRTRSAPMSNHPRQRLQRAQPAKLKNSDLLAATVWTKYREQLGSLMDMLNQTKSRYVRCIKPNSQKQPRITNLPSTVAQLRCSGLVAITRLSRATYSTSLPNKVLRFRYRNMWDQEKFPSKAKRIDKADRKYKLECEALLACALETLEVSKSDNGTIDLPYTVGKTTTYFKKGVLEFLEKNHVLELDGIVTVIQKHIRGVLARTRQADIRRAVLIIQQWYRKAKAKWAAEIKYAVIIIQQWYRKAKAERMAVVERAAPIIQQWYRQVKAERDAYLESVGGRRLRYLEARKIFEQNKRPSFQLQILKWLRSNALCQ